MRSNRKNSSLLYGLVAASMLAGLTVFSPLLAAPASVPSVPAAQSIVTVAAGRGETRLDAAQTQREMAMASASSPAEAVQLGLPENLAPYLAESQAAAGYHPGGAMTPDMADKIMQSMRDKHWQHDTLPKLEDGGAAMVLIGGPLMSLYGMAVAARRRRLRPGL